MSGRHELFPPSPPLSLAHWQGGTSEPHYCRRIYEAEPNGKEKASVNNCRELHSQLWNLIKYAVIRHKDQKHYSTPTESYGGTLISNRPTVQKKKKRKKNQTSSHTCPTHKPKETLPLPSEKNNSQHLRLIKYMKQERGKKKKSSWDSLGGEERKGRSCQSWEGCQHWPWLQGPIQFPGLLSSLPSKTDSVSQMDDWWLPVLSSLAKPPGGPCWDLALQQQAWPSRKRAAGSEPSPRDTQKQHPVLFFPRTIQREVGRGLFVQLTEVKWNTSALHAKTAHYLKITLTTKKKKKHPPKTPQQLFCGHAERTFLISFPARILTTICTLNCLENTGE